MKLTIRLFAVAAVAALALPGAAEESAPTDRFLSRARQLTFEGQRAGEGYFSPDGTRFVFQSEREPGNPFYQIYELSFETGETRRVSPGSGKTTCAFFRPGGNEILFASTHHDENSRTLQEEEYALRKSGKERRYAWDYDPEMDLYAARPDGTLVRLTNARGYDAEGSYSPDGRWIVFSSTRIAYDGSTPVDEQKLAVDPSFYAELYRMPADGGEAVRLTHTDGYDGGPFFTPDGARIVWRRFDAEGLIADIWTMKVDGSDARRITDFRSMSWAPYPHPSGEYFIFTSNKHGFENFELFLVDTEGTREPVRVTFTGGFDGLPVFSPDGGRMAWTSGRGEVDGAQLWLARWNHEAALAALAAAPQREDRP